MSQFRILTPSSTSIDRQNRDALNFPFSIGYAVPTIPMVSLGNIVIEGRVGVVLKYSFMIKGGTPPYEFTCSNFPLGLGLAVSGEGIMSGTPLKYGLWNNIQVIVTDAAKSVHVINVKRLVIYKKRKHFNSLGVSLMIPFSSENK